jgi:hypothetical protein
MKKNIILTFLLSVLSVFNISCDQSSDQGIEGYQDFRENADSIRFSEFRVVSLTSDLPLSSADKITVADSLIFIKTNDGLCSFDWNGRFVSQYGAKGRASNEYLYATSFFVDTDSKEVCLIDATQEKFLYFSYDGTFLRKETLEGLAETFPYDVQLLPGRKLMVNNRIYGSLGNLFSIYDLKDGSHTDLRPVSIETDDVADMCGEKMFSLYDGKISYLMPFEPFLYSYENGGEKVRYQFANVGKVLNKRKQKKVKDYSFYKAFELLNEGMFVGFSGIYETSSYVLLNELTEYRYCILDKNSGKFRRYQYSISNDDDECVRLPLIAIKCTYGDWLVGMASPMKMLQYKDVDFIGNDSNLKELAKAVEDITLDSNPCLFFYKIASI